MGSAVPTARLVWGLVLAIAALPGAGAEARPITAPLKIMSPQTEVAVVPTARLVWAPPLAIAVRPAVSADLPRHSVLPDASQHLERVTLMPPKTCQLTGLAVVQLVLAERRARDRRLAIALSALWVASRRLVRARKVPTRSQPTATAVRLMASAEALPNTAAWDGKRLPLPY